MTLLDGKRAFILKTLPDLLGSQRLTRNARELSEKTQNQVAFMAFWAENRLRVSNSVYLVSIEASLLRPQLFEGWITLSTG